MYVKTEIISFLRENIRLVASRELGECLLFVLII